MAVLAGSSPALAQDASAAGLKRPRLELGAGVSAFYGGGSMPYTTWMVDARIGVKASQNWSLEGLVHIMPESAADIAGYYRAQALRRFGQGNVRPFVAFGGAGEFTRYSWPEYHYPDYQTGEQRVVQSGTNVSVTAPYYPTATIGCDAVRAAHLAVRVELTAAFGINDYGVAVAFVPAVSVSVPIGRYSRTPR
jgi:hypothetical protein